jgi:3-oxoacyl-[acyl-carrier protein] reductase
MLENKVAIVTGGSRGIGRSIVLTLAKAGVKVAFNYLKSEQEAQQLLKEIEAMGSEALCLKSDTRDYEASREFVEKVKSHFGSLDYLVNNAGIVRDKAFMLMAKSDWDEVIETNLTGYFNMARAVIVTLLKQKSGGIVNISSISGVGGIARQVNYAASKAGIIGLTRSLAKEVAPYNIRVNCVAPGFIATDITRSMKEDLKEKFTETIPFKRFGQGDDVAKTVLFLLSDRAGYITGQVIKVDGGLHMSY